MKTETDAAGALEAGHMKPLDDGWIKRDAQSGRLIEVGTKNGVTRATDISRSSVGEASSRRRSALKRLADR
jgi:hypothetical protein